ncbi:MULTISPECIES: hypothetical protein [Methylobacterium]|jgi:hypothetical protein|uniref:Uncharacterized protein n=1 Tax=Methylobacterium isbiliense TaxID=315478 RepID=A0ABQ4SK36_9HYPH|nr:MULTISPECIES: hypothetical protein [Methylobacterium]MBY0298473.1 hypothetical protein [Methylobacterium sp.]MDN3624925.1 hypothetical protein [Methylobacterium isbiliense]GJE03517.1 hypothetical protein GMJLKIPL_5474 [Methylobacterium isbiliense]
MAKLDGRNLPYLLWSEKALAHSRRMIDRSYEVLRRSSIVLNSLSYQRPEAKARSDDKADRG